ncbi:DUF3440 domain-containing protein [Enterococcus faecalis]|uniref:DUF3440 domain-containing protein n=1 Tax=Enterococcus faecalis TaxID=1351 RepID=UPI001F5A331C|nr:DUF3440 domain-containing protein [Enterococcus faecalis]
MKKVTLNKNVYEAWLERFAYISEKFDHLILAFSGGKDSGVLLELVEQYYRKNHLKNKISVYHLDYEGGYTHTIEYINRVMNRNQAFDYYHICMPISASCGVSMYQATWMPWDPTKKELWVRERPDTAIHLENHSFDFFTIGMSDYKFQNEFCKWLHKQKQAHRTAVLIGIRAQESLNRFHAVTRGNTFSMFGTIPYSSRVTPTIFKFYPIYDWKVEDIWTANMRFGWDYNKLYDLYYYAGVPLKYMRVANPFHQCGVDALKLYRIIEPDTWGNLLGRVNGANFSAIYGGTKAVGFRQLTLPQGHTWKSYVNFLLKSLPEQTREIYMKKFKASKKYWLETGGALLETVVNDLKDTDLSFEILGEPTSKRTYKQKYVLVRFKEYPDEVTIQNFRLVPSYKRMCITILKNDTSCNYMGYSQTKNELQLKEEMCRKWHQLI